jgi:uncharacterized protein (TIGR03067 family)
MLVRPDLGSAHTDLALVHTDLAPVSLINLFGIPVSGGISMRCLCFSPLVLVLVGLSGLVGPSSAQADDTSVWPVVHWSGTIVNADLEKFKPESKLVTSQKDFDRLWKAWRGEERSPRIDFKNYFVAVETIAKPGGGIYQLRVDRNGDGSLLPYAKGTKEEFKGFSYGIALFPRSKVKTFNGQPIEPEAPSDKDRLALQDKWQVVSVVKEGAEDKTGNAPKYIVFDGDKIKIMVDPDKKAEATGRFKVDAEKTPKNMDVVVGKKGDKDSTGFLIYELKGDDLKLCAAANERPKAFTSTTTDKQMIIVLKRVK